MLACRRMKECLRKKSRLAFQFGSVRAYTQTKFNFNNTRISARADRIVSSFGCIFYNASLHARNCTPRPYFILRLPLLRSFIVCNIIFSIIHLRSLCMYPSFISGRIRVVYRTSWLVATRIYIQLDNFSRFFRQCLSWYFHFNIWHSYLAFGISARQGVGVLRGICWLLRVRDGEVPYRVPQTLFYFICCQFTSHSVSHVTREAAVFLCFIYFTFFACCKLTFE